MTRKEIIKKAQTECGEYATGYKGDVSEGSLTKICEMMYYIDKVNTWSPANRKWQEVQAFVVEYRQMLIPNDDAAKELVEEIRQKVEELNKAYPRTQRITVKQRGNFVCCDNEECEVDDKHVFTFHIEKVRQTYKTLEMMMDGK